MLSALIRKGGLTRAATATPATSATHKDVNIGTVAEVATVAVANPAEAQSTSPYRFAVPAMGAAEETAIRAWLAFIDEHNPDFIAEVLAKCGTDLEARSYFLLRTEEVPLLPPPEREITCGDCRHFQRIEHPHIGYCADGRVEAVPGLWDTDRRYCESFVSDHR